MSRESLRPHCRSEALADAPRALLRLSASRPAPCREMPGSTSPADRRSRTHKESLPRPPRLSGAATFPDSRRSERWDQCEACSGGQQGARESGQEWCIRLRSSSRELASAISARNSDWLRPLSHFPGATSTARNRYRLSSGSGDDNRVAIEMEHHPQPLIQEDVDSPEWPAVPTRVASRTRRPLPRASTSRRS